jgi:hypothetical protein
MDEQKELPYGYHGALMAAGANVKAFEEFGSYQGEWWALVEYEGQRGWVNGSYGSCSGCDAFQAEFVYDDKERWDDAAGKYVPNPEYPAKLAEFGREYLGNIHSDQAAVNAAARNLDWDLEAEEMVEFIVNRAKEDGVLVIAPKGTPK